jgi:hypothetical protein
MFEWQKGVVHSELATQGWLLELRGLRSTDFQTGGEGTLEEMKSIPERDISFFLRSARLVKPKIVIAIAGSGTEL